MQGRCCFVHPESVQKVCTRSSYSIEYSNDAGVLISISLWFLLITTNRFDKVARSGRVLGKRTVAGRIVKESYGAAKQQHTFTVRTRICTN